MTEETTPSAVTCALCGGDLGEPIDAADGSGPYCSAGCRDVGTTLGTGDGVALETEPELEDTAAASLHCDDFGDDASDDDGGASPESDTAIEAESQNGKGSDTSGDEERDTGDREEDEASDADPAPAITRTFLRIDGMHSAACEAFLESVAEGLDGVLEAEASYVTETIRVDHDRVSVPEADLEEALSTLGYTAYLREEASNASASGAASTNATGPATGAETGPTRRAREMSGVRKRRSDDMLDVRYILGVVFGSFLLIPYVAVLYPAYLAAVFPVGPLQYFDTAFSDGGVLFARVYFVLTGIVLYVTGKPLLRGAYVSLTLRRPTPELLATFTIVAAYAYGMVGFVTGGGHVYFDLVVVVAALVMGAILYESASKRKAFEALTDLTISQVDTARRLGPDGEPQTVEVDDLETGDRVLVRQGERIPVDGRLAEGACTVDESVVTGESVPIEKDTGDDLVGGSVVTTDAAVVRVGEGSSSSIDRLTTAVWNLQSADHGIQRRADRLAERLLPALAAVAALVFLGTLVLGSGLADATLATLLAVVVASPWALGFATPLSIATSVEAALERGVVVFDETVFERLRAVDVVVFDKTGTLTRGEMDVLEADAPTDLLESAGRLERRASHPAADAIASVFAGGGEGGSDGEGGTDHGARADGGVEADSSAGSEEVGRGQVREFESHGNGVEGVVDGERVLVGHPDCFADLGWSVGEALEARVREARGVSRLPVVVGRDGAAEGVVVVGDEARTGWEDTLSSLGARGVDVVVLTGDDEAASEAFAAHPDVTHVFAGVSPAGKIATIRRLREDGRVAMVGDGTNDALALAAADLGISLGGGTALASDAADLALVEDDLEAVETAFDLASAARRRVERNQRLAFVYNALAIPLALAGLFNPLFAMAAVTAAAVVIGVNSWRPLL